MAFGSLGAVSLLGFHFLVSFKIVFISFLLYDSCVGFRNAVLGSHLVGVGLRVIVSFLIIKSIFLFLSFPPARGWICLVL